MYVNAFGGIVAKKNELRLEIDETMRRLFREIAEIELQACERHELDHKDLCTVFTKFYGGYQIRFAFCAERTLMRRIAEQMSGEPVTELADLAEYMEEFINIICGHVVALVFGKTKRKARFHSPCFVEGCYMLENVDEDLILNCYKSQEAESVSLLYDQMLLKI